ncbi:MAG: SsrA-binding protein SmpB [Bacteroidales bacterium]|nr:SsrA-binding protein SmpB [Bacteroidales bacterium]
MKVERNILIKNKKATFDYILLDTYTAGMVLTGTELKSIRLGKASLTDSYAMFYGGELWAKGIQISAYENGTYNNHNPKRDRKLLLTRRELRKIERQTKETGFTIVPLKMFINDKGWVKLEIAVAKGKKAYDKRDSLKEKDDRRVMDRAFKSRLS